MQAGAPAQGPVAAFVVALGPGPRPDDDSDRLRRRGLLQTDALVRVVARILTAHAVAGEAALRNLVVRSPPTYSHPFDRPGQVLALHLPVWSDGVLWAR